MPRVSAVVFSTMLFMTFAMPADAALITFNSAALFASAAPGLPVETFETGLVSPGDVTVCSEPLSAAAPNACFAAGALLPGITYSVAGPGTDMVVLGANFDTIGNTSKVLGANAFSDTTDLTFASTVNAFGFNVFGGAGGTGVAQISIFSPANLSLGMLTIPVPLSGPAFFGAISTTDLIGRVNVASLPNGGELVDNVAFGSVSTVPEPTSMLLLGTGLLGVGMRRVSRRWSPTAKR